MRPFAHGTPCASSELGLAEPIQPAMGTGGVVKVRSVHGRCLRFRALGSTDARHRRARGGSGLRLYLGHAMVRR